MSPSHRRKQRGTPPPHRAERSRRQRGLQPGVGANSALGLVPEIRLLQRDTQAELQGLETIACWAYTWVHR